MAGELVVSDLYAKLRAKENQKLLSTQELHQRNLQWLQDILGEASALFRKEPKRDSGYLSRQLSLKSDPANVNAGTEDDENQEDHDNSGCSAVNLPVLLPQTPRVSFLPHLTWKLLDF